MSSTRISTSLLGLLITVLMATTSTTAQRQGATKVYKTATVFFKWRDVPQVPVAAKEFPGIINDIFNTWGVRSYFAEQSRGTVDFVGPQRGMPSDYFGWIKVDMTIGNDCDPRKIMDSVKRAWGQENFDKYDRVIMFPNYQPQSEKCSWVGQSDTPGKGVLYHFFDTRGKRSDATSLPLLAHELGHNEGFGHSMAFKWNNGEYVVDPYGDPYDIMGSGRTAPLTFGGTFPPPSLKYLWGIKIPRAIELTSIFHKDIIFSELAGFRRDTVSRLSPRQATTN